MGNIRPCDLPDFLIMGGKTVPRDDVTSVLARMHGYGRRSFCIEAKSESNKSYYAVSRINPIRGEDELGRRFTDVAPGCVEFYDDEYEAIYAVARDSTYLDACRYEDGFSEYEDEEEDEDEG